MKPLKVTNGINVDSNFKIKSNNKKDSKVRAALQLVTPRGSYISTYVKTFIN